jgi:hypothetical protein
MAILDNRIYYDYNRMSSIKPLTAFEDIEVGETYHIAPIVIYDRRDFKVESKSWNTISGTVTYADGSTSYSTLYKTELSMKYLVKKQKINQN